MGGGGRQIIERANHQRIVAVGGPIDRRDRQHTKHKRHLIRWPCDPTQMNPAHRRNAFLRLGWGHGGPLRHGITAIGPAKDAGDVTIRQAQKKPGAMGMGRIPDAVCLQIAQEKHRCFDMAGQKIRNRGGIGGRGPADHTQSPKLA